MNKNGLGKITHGIANGTFAMKTMQFVQSQLPIWRDLPKREQTMSEEVLNGQLCKWLNIAANKQDFSMVYFHHEERQGTRHRVDISAGHIEPQVIEGRSYSELTPLLVIECKRLPTPGKDRTKEYVTGISEPTGGIQRFKLGLHGDCLSHAGMIGYIQSRNIDEWFKSINEWISELVKSSNDWQETELLQSLCKDVDNRVSSCSSTHSRTNKSAYPIALQHLWIEL